MSDLGSPARAASGAGGVLSPVKAAELKSIEAAKQIHTDALSKLDRQREEEERKFRAEQKKVEGAYKRMTNLNYNLASLHYALAELPHGGNEDERVRLLSKRDALNGKVDTLQQTLGTLEAQLEEKEREWDAYMKKHKRSEMVLCGRIAKRCLQLLEMAFPEHKSVAGEVDNEDDEEDGSHRTAGFPDAGSSADGRDEGPGVGFAVPFSLDPNHYGPDDDDKWIIAEADERRDEERSGGQSEASRVELARGADTSVGGPGSPRGSVPDFGGGGDDSDVEAVVYPKGAPADDRLSNPKRARADDRLSLDHSEDNGGQSSADEPGSGTDDESEVPPKRANRAKKRRRTEKARATEESTDGSGVDMEDEDIEFGGGGDIDFGEEERKRSEDSGKSNRDGTSIDTTDGLELDDATMEYISHINSCTLTDIKPSPIGLDGVGVYAGTQIAKGAVLFETPRGCAEPEYVELTGVQVMALVTNPVALNAIEKRFPPEFEDGDDDPCNYIFCIPLSGPNGLSIPDFINHASSEGADHNVTYGKGEDAYGNQMLETTRDVKEGEELIIEHDIVMAERFEKGIAFVESILSGNRAVVAARRRADAVRDGMDEDALELVDNLNNNVCLQLGPSNVHGVGLIVGDGGSNLVEAGVDPLQLPVGYQSVETIDITQAQLEKLVTDPLALSKIRRHCCATLTPSGEWVLALPAAGFNAMDISHYLNSAEGTGEMPHVFTVCDQIDQRGLNPMVIEAGVEVADGDEILADYKLAPDLNDWDGVLVEQSAKEVARDDDQTYVGDDDDDDDNDDELSFKTDGDVSQAGSEDSKAVAGLSIETAESNLEEMARLGGPSRFERADGIPQTFWIVAREAKEALASLTEEERKKRMFHNPKPAIEFLLLEWNGDGIVGGQLPEGAKVLAFCSSSQQGSNSLVATLKVRRELVSNIPPQGRRIGKVLVVPFREETMGDASAFDFDAPRLAELLKEHDEIAAYKVNEELDSGAMKHIGDCASMLMLGIACNIAQLRETLSNKRLATGKYRKAAALRKLLEKNNLLIEGWHRKTWKTEDPSLRKEFEWVVEDDAGNERTFWISATVTEYSSWGRTRARLIAAAKEQKAIDEAAEEKRVNAMKIVPKKDRKLYDSKSRKKCCKLHNYTKNKLPFVREVLYAHQNEGPVCAFDEKCGDIQDFDGREEAHLANYSVAHCGSCGACSTWNDLELQYSTRHNLAEMAQECGMKTMFQGIDGLQKCLETDIGWTSNCARCWAEDIYCTKRWCIFIYLQSRMTNQLGNFEVDPNSITSATCEEANCEAGNPGHFVQCSGSNRRRMNITSDIARPADEQCQIVDVADW